MMILSVAIATNSPAAPPHAASSHDSVRSCRISCRRVAPSDRRTAISPARAADRARSKLAMLAHAISSTIAGDAEQQHDAASWLRLAIPLWPCAPGSTTTGFVLKRAIVCSLMFFWSGTSTWLTMPE